MFNVVEFQPKSLIYPDAARSLRLERCRSTQILWTSKIAEDWMFTRKRRKATFAVFPTHRGIATVNDVWGGSPGRTAATPSERANVHFGHKLSSSGRIRRIYNSSNSAVCRSRLINLDTYQGSTLCKMPKSSFALQNVRGVHQQFAQPRGDL